MKIVVCVRQGLDGDIGPFDACAYETALQQKDAEIILLSMGPKSVKEFLVKMSRLGATRCVLLSDKRFAGADTLATSYTLARAIEKLNPDLVICGRQTLVGDTGQVGPMMAQMLSFKLFTGAMKVSANAEAVICEKDEGISAEIKYPALITVERINTLRLPSLRSKTAECDVWNAEDIEADLSKIGFNGSPTRVLETFENKDGRRKCKFISFDMLEEVIQSELALAKQVYTENNCDIQSLDKVLCVGNAPLSYAKTVSKNPKIITDLTFENVLSEIERDKPDAVIFGSDYLSKELAAKISAHLSLGLCADCTVLKAEDDKLIMYRPALSGSIIAKIESLTKPAMATVRTTSADISDIVVSAGCGVKGSLKSVEVFAEKLGADIVTTRKMVDMDVLPYKKQVGLTGKTISPKIYIAIGVSGAVHHIVGMRRSGVVIAINPDKNASIFDYADYGILEEFR